MKPKLAVILPALLALLLVGCAGQQMRTKSSVVDYLYPEQGSTNVQPGIPRLTLPIKVGIAFVPGSTEAYGNNYWTGRMKVTALTERDKMQLLDKVAAHFEKYDFVKSIEVIPSSYLRPQGSFANLDQIKTMYGIDVIALVSHDQVQFVDEGLLSLSYWTLVGAYVISGEKNDTSTLMDTAVYDIDSRKLLFRAPGVSQVKGSATPVNLSEQLREDAVQGFREATEDMIRNLDLQLERFREKVKQQPEEYQIVHSGGGGGAAGWLLGILLPALLYARRKSPHSWQTDKT